MTAYPTDQAGISSLVLSSLLEGVQVIGPDWRYRYVNPAAAAHGRSTPEALVGRTMEECYPGISATPLFAVLRRVMETSEPEQLTNEFTFPDGRRGWFELRIERVALGLTILSIDVTRQREAEQALQQAMRTEALGRLAGGVAHDFNSLLSVISGYASVLERAVAGEQREDVHQIQEAVRRAARLTGQLLAFARDKRVSPEQLDVWRVVDDVLGFSRGVLGAGIDLDVTHRPRLPLVRIDPGALEQVVLNLLMNARDAMSGRGRIAIAGAVATIGPDEVVRARGERIRPGRYVHLTVSDTGVGMSAEVLARLFDPFFTTKGDRGHGLGLASSFGLVRQACGYLTADSEVGKGSTFHLYLPAEPPTG